MQKKNKSRIALKIIWWIYIIALFLLVIIKFRGSISEITNRIEAYSVPNFVNYNLIPFRSIGVQLKNISEGWARFNLFGNIVPFIPFGFLLPIAFVKINSFWKVVGIGFAVDICMEIFQYITKTGSFDIDDIILNMIGIVLGYLLMKFTTILLVKKQQISVF